MYFQYIFSMQFSYWERKMIRIIRLSDRSSLYQNCHPERYQKKEISRSYNKKNNKKMKKRIQNLPLDPRGNVQFRLPKEPSFPYSHHPY